MDIKGFRNLQKYTAFLNSEAFTKIASNAIIRADSGGNPYHDPKTGQFAYAPAGISEDGANTPCVGFASNQKASAHQKHLKEFGNISMEEYTKRGIDLLSKPCGGDIVGYITGKGEVCRFNKTTGEYAKGYPGKAIKTYFIPKWSGSGDYIGKSNDYFTRKKAEEGLVRVEPKANKNSREDRAMAKMVSRMDRDEKHVCPVCGKYTFEYEGSYDVCPVCGWEDDSLQEANPDEEGGANQMSLNQAREAYGQGQQVK